MFLLDPIPQDPAYHRFTDTREFFGIPNFWNVVSNLPFLVVGIASIAWWIRTEAAGHGDLRPYALVQFLPMLLLPLMLLMWKGDGVSARHLWVALGVYAAAKLAEYGDFHAMKHLLAALAAWWIIRAFQRSPASAL